MQEFTKLNVEKSFKVLNGFPRYIALEQNENVMYEERKYKEQIKEILEYGIRNNLEQISVLLTKTFSHYENMIKILKSHGFIHHSSVVEYTKDLTITEEYPMNFKWSSLEDPNLTEQEFMKYWEECMLFSDNKSSTRTMEQHLQSVVSELGEGWRNSCRVFF